MNKKFRSFLGLLRIFSFAIFAVIFISVNNNISLNNMWNIIVIVFALSSLVVTTCAGIKMMEGKRIIMLNIYNTILVVLTFLTITFGDVLYDLLKFHSATDIRTGFILLSASAAISVFDLFYGKIETTTP